MGTVLRVATPEDGAACASIYAPYVADTVASFELVPPTPEDMAGRIANTLPDYPWLIAERDGAVAGYACGARHHIRPAYRWGVDVAVYIHAAHHRAGIGRALYAALLAILRAQNFETAYGGITLPNPGSVGLHEVCGFRPVGLYRRAGYKMAAWHDVGWWELVLGGAGDPPAEPVPFAEHRTRPGWDDALAIR